MKYLALLVIALSLISCAQTTWPPPSAIENPPPPPVIISSGTSGEVDWSCQLTELNPALAMAACDFQNKLPRAVPPVCITLAFFDDKGGDLVVESRPLCSGLLPAHHLSTNYAAFQKEKRVALRKCGDDLHVCVMLAGAVQ